jgi:hypothetical protein
MEILVRRRKQFWHSFICASFRDDGGDMSPTEQTDWRALGSAAQMAATAMQTAQAAQQTALQGAVAWIADVDITYSGLLALNLAPKVKTFDVAAAKAGDRVYVHPRAEPTLTGVNVVGGILLQSTGSTFADGKVDVYHVIPAIGVGQTLIIPVKLVGYRPPAST